MQYIERTLQVKATLLNRPDLLNVLRSIFLSVIEHEVEPEERWAGSGATRNAYTIGNCAIEDVGGINILLKLFNKQHERERTWAGALGRPYTRLSHGHAEEFGVFETYYDFAAGHIECVSFGSRRKFNRYLKETDYDRLKPPDMHINLSEWEGLRVAYGDLGALPFFQMAVKFGKYFGWLTEGNPPIIKPKGTADECGYDDHNVERGRIIDLSAHHCTLREINGEKPFSRRYHPDHLGLIARGKKYFLPENRLDL